jgi:spore germination cell wall hydrolase CwlJ-like protein
MVQYLRIAAYAVAIMIASVFVYTITTGKLNELKMERASLPEEVITAKERERQLDCLAINIYREAGYEPFEGKVAVAQVTMNRVEDPQFPNDVCAVVYQKTTVVKTVCQFSWYCDTTHRNRPKGPGYAESYEVAKKVLLEGFRLPSLEAALFYHADYINPNWKLDRITKVGTHIFYKQRQRAERYAKI